MTTGGSVVPGIDGAGVVLHSPNTRYFHLEVIP